MKDRLLLVLLVAAVLAFGFGTAALVDAFLTVWNFGVLILELFSTTPERR